MKLVSPLKLFKSIRIMDLFLFPLMPIWQLKWINQNPRSNCDLVTACLPIFVRNIQTPHLKIYSVVPTVVVVSSATSNPRPAAPCGPVEGFVWPSLVFAVVIVSCILTSCPCFNNLEFDIFGAGGPRATLSRLLPL